jgi:hypothetical protein
MIGGFSEKTTIILSVFHTSIDLSLVDNILPKADLMYIFTSIFTIYCVCILFQLAPTPMMKFRSAGGVAALNGYVFALGKSLTY